MKQPGGGWKPSPADAEAAGVGGGGGGVGGVDLKDLIHGHSLFFDQLVELIPARFYLPADGDKPWLDGLSNAAKAATKKESRENLKKARRARLDPEKSSSTLDLLKKSIEAEKSEANSSNEGSESDAEIENARPVIGDDRSVTYEELRQRLQRRIEELRANRNTRPLSKAKAEKREKRMDKKKNQKSKKKKEAAGDGAPSTQVKRKQEEESEEEKAKKKKKKAKLEKGVDASLADISFGKVNIGDEDGKRKKKRKLSKKQALERAEKLEEAKKDPEKGEMVSMKHSWKAAVSRAAGVKVHDNPKLLKESIKKEKKQHKKHVEKWTERMETTSKMRAEKQKTRAENIKERIHQKKMRRIEKREKKLMRPGFEGRKEGYINE